MLLHSCNHVLTGSGHRDYRCSSKHVAKQVRDASDARLRSLPSALHWSAGSLRNHHSQYDRSNRRDRYLRIARPQDHKGANPECKLPERVAEPGCKASNHQRVVTKSTHRFTGRPGQRRVPPRLHDP